MSIRGAIGFSLALLPLGARAEPPGPGESFRAPGREVFDAAACGSCHRIAGRGGNAGPDLTLVGFRRSPEWLRLWLRDPKAWKPDTRMPDFRLRPGDLEALVGYLAGLGPAASAATREAPSVEQGRRLFSSLGCVACHGPAGQGGHPNNNVPGGIIPALPALAATYTEDELYERIRRGKRPEKEDPAGPEPLVSMPAWGEALDEAQLHSLALYVKGLGASAPPSDW